MSRMGLAAAILLASAPAAVAGEADGDRPAVAVDVFASSDADDTEVSKVGVSLDWRRASETDYAGVRVESATFKPLGQDATRDLRAYYRFAQPGERWSWNGQAGTDGRTVIGAVNVHNANRLRQEYFLEREIVETPQGVRDGIYYTFAGGALDLPIDDRNNVTLVAAAQAFTGRNVRFHARANYVHVLQPDWGLSVQLRTRYFRSTEPGEYDYFSPREFAQVVPVIQLRRRVTGWRILAAGGVGGQWQTGSGWTQARTFNAQVTSPPISKTWAVEAAFTYSNTPIGAGYTYDYRQVSLGVRRSF